MKWREIHGGKTQFSNNNSNIVSKQLFVDDVPCGSVNHNYSQVYLVVDLTWFRRVVTVPVEIEQ